MVWKERKTQGSLELKKYLKAKLVCARGILDLSLITNITIVILDPYVSLVVCKKRPLFCFVWGERFHTWLAPWVMRNTKQSVNNDPVKSWLVYAYLYLPNWSILLRIPINVRPSRSTTSSFSANKNKILNIWICDMIKRNESDVGDIGFEILAKTVFQFLCFILCLSLTNSS